MTNLQVAEELQAGILELNAARTRLLTLETRLPVTLAEITEEDLKDVDFTTEVRSVLRCVVEDFVRPAIEDLQAVCARAKPETAE